MLMGAVEHDGHIHSALPPLANRLWNG
jgi:hypothetical protein